MQAKNITCALGRKTILHDVSFEVEKGNITVLLGKNGSGKTTLLRALTGLIKIKEGQITIDDRNLSLHSDQEIAKKFAYLPQHLPAPAITVRELLELARYPYTSFGRKMTEKDQEMIESSLVKTEMKEMENHLVCHLSGGERTMAYLGMMLAKDSDYYFLDEPYASLDIPSQSRLTSILEELKKQGKHVLLSVHDLLLAIQIADRVILLDQGKLLFSGTKEEFLSSHCYEDVYHVDILEVMDSDGNKYPVLKKKD